MFSIYNLLVVIALRVDTVCNVSVSATANEPISISFAFFLTSVIPPVALNSICEVFELISVNSKLVVPGGTSKL